MDDVKHGGNIYDAASRWGRCAYDILDFSANINPLGLPPGLTDCLSNHWDALLHYPDPEYKELYKALAHYLGVDEHFIILGNGAIDIIYDYMRAMRPSHVLIPSPTFSEYKRAAAITGSCIDIWPMGAGFKLDVKALCDVLAQNRYDMLVLCNPNNPTGGLLDKPSLMEIADCAREHGINVLLDETFIEFTSDYVKCSMVDLVDRYPNLCVVRAFTKFFAMPGLRLGYGVMSRYIRELLNSVQPPWSVNAMAMLAGVYVLKDYAYMEQTRHFVREQRLFLTTQLSSIPWMSLYPSCANFILIKLQKPSITAAVLQQHLSRYGILIRDASTFDGLDEHYVRLAVKDQYSNHRLIEALKDFDIDD